MKRQLFPVRRAAARFLTAFQRLFLQAAGAAAAPLVRGANPADAADPLSPLHAIHEPLAAFTSADQSSDESSEAAPTPAAAMADFNAGSDAALAFTDCCSDPAF